MLLWSHHVSLIIRHTHPPFFLPERCLFQSVRCVKNPGGCTDSDSVSRVSHVSVKQRMLQSLMSLWKATLARISSTLLSSDWTLASSMLGSGGRCARLRSLTRRLLRCPFCGTVVLGQRLGFNPLSRVVDQTEDLLQESRIPGRYVGELTLLLYPIVPPVCM